MKVVHIVPGSGGTFYCQNCVRDTSLVKALRRLGHDVLMVPLYLPIFTDDSNATGDTPVFFDPHNVSSLVAAIHRVLEQSPEERERRRRSGSQRAAQYTWDACAWRVVSALRKA